MSVLPTLTAVTPMLSVVTLKDLTIVHVKLDIPEMAKVALVSQLFNRSSAPAICEQVSLSTLEIDISIF